VSDVLAYKIQISAKQKKTQNGAVLMLSKDDHKKTSLYPLSNKSPPLL
jgi:hypothetical protein